MNEILAALADSPMIEAGSLRGSVKLPPAHVGAGRVIARETLMTNRGEGEPTAEIAMAFLKVFAGSV